MNHDYEISHIKEKKRKKQRGNKWNNALTFNKLIHHLILRPLCIPGMSILLNDYNYNHIVSFIFLPLCLPCPFPRYSLILHSSFPFLSYNYDRVKNACVFLLNDQIKWKKEKKRTTNRSQKEKKKANAWTEENLDWQKSTFRQREQGGKTNKNQQTINSSSLEYYGDDGAKPNEHITKRHTNKRPIYLAIKKVNNKI